MSVNFRTAVCGLVMLLSLFAQGCRESSPWVAIDPDQTVYSMQELPLQKLHQDPDSYLGDVFEGQFKFYRIYHDREDADPALRGQVIEGETHFTARPVLQYLQAIQIRITPAQEQWIRAQGVERQDAITARIRFQGMAPGESLAFELLEVTAVPGKKKGKP